MEAYNAWFTEFQLALQDDKYDTLKELVSTANSVNKAIPKDKRHLSFIAWEDTYNSLLRMYEGINLSVSTNPSKHELQVRISKWYEISTTSPSFLSPVSYPSTPSGVPTEFSHHGLADSVGVVETASQAGSAWSGAESIGHRDDTMGLPFVGYSNIASIPPFSGELIPKPPNRKEKYPTGPPAKYPCEACAAGGKDVQCFTVAKASVKMCYGCAVNSRRCSRVKRNQNLEFSVIDALRGLQAAQKRHVEITTQQAVLSEERHTGLMQGLHEATGNMTLLSQKVENLTNVMLQSYGGLPVLDQSLPDFSYSVNPPDLSFP